MLVQVLPTKNCVFVDFCTHCFTVEKLDNIKIVSRRWSIQLIGNDLTLVMTVMGDWS